MFKPHNDRTPDSYAPQVGVYVEDAKCENSENNAKMTVTLGPSLRSTKNAVIDRAQDGLKAHESEPARFSKTPAASNAGEKGAGGAYRRLPKTADATTNSPEAELHGLPEDRKARFEGVRSSVNHGAGYQAGGFLQSIMKNPLKVLCGVVIVVPLLGLAVFGYGFQEFFPRMELVWSKNPTKASFGS